MYIVNTGKGERMNGLPEFYPLVPLHDLGNDELI